MNDQFSMNSGDMFVATVCGCAMTVTSGPSDPMTVKQAPQCCCGHEMVKQSASGDSVTDTDAVDPAGA